MDDASESEWDPTSPNDDEFYGFSDVPKQNLPQEHLLPLEDVNDIRVFTITRSAASDDRVVCNSSTVTLNNPPAYFALSYAWGWTKEDNSHLTHDIWINGAKFKITETLYEALLRIRGSMATQGLADVSESPALWVDAICINQNNPIERSRQVMMMDKIFASAQRLLVWLGEILDEKIDVLRTQAFRDGAGDLTALGLAEGTLLQRSYFTRMWVIQEAICSRTASCTLMFGRHQAVVSNLVEVLEGREASFKECHHGAADPGLTPPFDTLMLNLLKFRHKKCSDDRDRVYALKSISCDGKAVAIDYRQSLDKLYATLALKWIQNGYLCETLLCAGSLRQVNSQCECFPSWVPDWRLTVFTRGASTTSDLFETILLLCKRVSLTKLRGDKVDAKAWNRPDGIALRLPGWLVSRCQHKASTLDFVTLPTTRLSDCPYCYMHQTDLMYFPLGHKMDSTLMRRSRFFFPEHGGRSFFRLRQHNLVINSFTLSHPVMSPYHDLEEVAAGKNAVNVEHQSIWLY